MCMESVYCTMKESSTNSHVLWEIKRYKESHSSTNPVMNRHHDRLQLDVLYISNLD